MKDLLIEFIATYFKVSIGFFILANSFYLVILILGFINARRQYLENKMGITKRLGPLKSLKPISVLVPCYNEEKSIVASLYSMLRLDYPNYEIIVCNDGSKDRSLEVIKAEFDLYPVSLNPPQQVNSSKVIAVYKSRRYANLLVLDKSNGGKADALNAGINFSSYPLICCVDSDSIIDQDGLKTVALPFLEDDNLIATGGAILVANTSQREEGNSTTDQRATVDSKILAKIQAVEYLRAFMVGRLGWDLIGSDSIISGAFGLFRKSLVIEIGGYYESTVGEDMEMILRMQEHCFKIDRSFDVQVLPTPVCWTEAPSDLKSLKNQRMRWTQGLAESLWLHKKMIFRPWAGSLGMVGLPYYLFFELLSAPIEILGYIFSILGLSFGILNINAVLAFLAVTVVYGCILNLGAIIIDQLTYEKYSHPRDLWRLISGAILEHFGFRQFHLVWRLRGIFRWMRGKKVWGEMTRIGLK